MHELDLSRHSPLLDPHLHVWGWEIPVYLFLGGMAAGAMILVPLLSGRATPSRTLSRLGLLAPALVSVGMLALLLDLGHKLHAWRFYLAFRWSSPMSWGAWILVAVYPVSLLFALALLDPADLEPWLARFPRLAGPLRAGRECAVARIAGLRRASVVVGVGLGVYTGILLSALGARVLWSSAVLGPLFLASGVSAGAALLLLFRLSAGERAWLVRVDLWALGAEAALLALFVLGHATGGAEGAAALALLTRGPYAVAFWGLVVGAGLALPALLEALEHRLHRLAALAPALVLTGGLALRWVMVAAGQR
jgi:formate-dependent nitrite reductase membrane component NrfD